MEARLAFGRCHAAEAQGGPIERRRPGLTQAVAKPQMASAAAAVALDAADTGRPRLGHACDQSEGGNQIRSIPTVSYPSLE